LKDNLTAVVMDDVYATVKVAGIFQSSGKKYTVRGEGATSLEDLRNGPTVFIGAFAMNNYRDYAIVARFTDTNTGKLSVIAAGIGRGGTIAAGEFLTDLNDLAQIKLAAQAAGDKKNMEIVLSTQIIDGQPGSPKVEAAYFC
jgi:hypothetical protein